MSRLRIVTWNINSVRLRLPLLLRPILEIPARPPKVTVRFILYVYRICLNYTV